MLLVRLYGPSLERYVRRILPRDLKPKVGASDIVQSVLRALLTGRFHDSHSAQDIRSFEAWIRTLAYRRVMLLRRRHLASCRTIRRESPIADAMSLTDRQATPATIAANRDFWRMAQSLLSEEERTLVRLRVETELSWGQIAERIGGTPGKQMMAFLRIRRRLAERLSHDR
jgi:RNA polymerase sigma factor (sigma-70 family)